MNCKKREFAILFIKFIMLLLAGVALYEILGKKSNKTRYFLKKCQHFGHLYVIFFKYNPFGEAGVNIFL